MHTKRPQVCRLKLKTHELRSALNSLSSTAEINRTQLKLTGVPFFSFTNVHSHVVRIQSVGVQRVQCEPIAIYAAKSSGMEGTQLIGAQKCGEGSLHLRPLLAMYETNCKP
jgi:hypothetical protein